MSMHDVVRARVTLELDDGSEVTHEFFSRDDQPFKVTIDRRPGFPKAEHGPFLLRFPKWPSATTRKP